MKEVARTPRTTRQAARKIMLFTMYSLAGTLILTALLYGWLVYSLYVADWTPIADVLTVLLGGG